MFILERASPTPFSRGIPGLYFNPETIIISTPKSRFEFPHTQLIEQCPNNEKKKKSKKSIHLPDGSPKGGIISLKMNRNPNCRGIIST